MNLSKTIHGKLYCTVCEVFIASEANYAFHVLTMEHCENFTKASKRKNDKTSSNLEMSEATPPTVADALYSVNEDLREINCVKYDWFWASLAETINDQVFPASEVINTNPTPVPSSSKTITKSLISCEVCNVVLTSVDDYDDHTKSPRHIWNMKLRELGVPAHPDKANENSNKTNAAELSTNSNQVNQDDSEQLVSDSESLKFVSFPLLYCDACELLLNTFQQLKTHISGTSHKLCVQKKGKMKVKKVPLPTSNEYYCFSCKMILNSCSQYKEHKTGKKHKIKCEQLIGMGITIPPEEQMPEWNLPKVNPGKNVRYPEFYERFVLIKQGELQRSSKIRELPMFDDEKTTQTDSSLLQNLNTLEGEGILQHIYRIQNKDLKTADTLF